MDDPKRQPEPSQETRPTVFERPNRRDGNDRPDRAPPQITPGSLLGKYRVVKHLGQGGMGAVYEAVHTEIGKAVALKVLSRELATDPRAQARFLREALAASRLDHPHVVNVTDFASEGDIAYLVMELLRGEDLGAYLDRNPRGLFVEEAVDVILAVAAGVFAAHELGVVHRDIKPRNIFLARNHMRDIEPTVLDFGISKVDDGPVDQALTDSGVIVGTVQYVSPEHVRGAPTDARSDQYALGVVLYECLTGRLPHEGHTSYVLLQNIAEGRFQPPSAIRNGIPPELERRLLRAMSTDPKERFASVHVFGQALLEFASSKRRVMWAEYFGRSESPGAPAGPATRTSPLPGKPVARETAPRSETPPRPARIRPAVQVAETVYRDTPSPSLEQLRAPRRKRWIFIVLLAVGIGAAWAAFRTNRLPGWATNVIAPADTVNPTPGPSVAAQTSPVEEGPPSPPPTTTPPPEKSTVAPPVPVPVAAKPPAQTVQPTPSQGAAAAPTTTDSPPPPAGAEKPETPPVPTNITLKIASSPPGAAVFFDEEAESRGRTPLSLTLPRGGGRRVLWLRLAYHRVATRAVVPDHDQTLRFNLESAPPARTRPRPPTEEAPREGRYQKLEE